MTAAARPATARPAAARRARRTGPVAVAPALPRLHLAGEPAPGVDVLALPTRPGADPAGARVQGSLPPEAAGLDLDRVLAAEHAKGAAGEVAAVPVPGGNLERLLLVGLGDGSAPSMRKAGAALARRASSAAELVVDLRGVRDLPGPDGSSGAAPAGEAAGGALSQDALRGLAAGLLLASYRFSTVPAAAEPEQALRSVVLVVPDPAALQGALDVAVATCRATALARDLVNTPSLTKTPQWLAAQAQALLPDLEVTVRDELALREEGFGGLVGVGQGSSRPPRLITARYDGTPAGARARHVVLVGKGITFDSGGLSLKTSDGMVTMKDDMGGGAAVLGALRAVADLHLPIAVTGLVAAAENMPSGDAQRPGDVITQYGGRTVEVLNTDAEGRLVLADALAYADLELDADLVVDVATLTGAMPVALGRRIAGLFSTDDALAGSLERAGTDAGEPVWRLPLVEDYRTALDSPTADLRNVGDPRLKLQGGSITAALFLREFTGGRPWAHLDIAGPAWSGGAEDELSKGGTGFGVRLLVRWLTELAAGGLPAPPRRPARRRRQASGGSPGG